MERGFGYRRTQENKMEPLKVPRAPCSTNAHSSTKWGTPAVGLQIQPLGAQ